MSEATLRGYIKTALDGVSNIGKVYDFQKFSDTYPDYLSKFKTTISGTAQIRGWTITLNAMENEQTAMKRLSRRVYQYQIEGYMSIDDSAATEKTFAALVEAVLNGLDDSTSIHAATAHAGYANVTDFGHIIFGDVLCHYVQISQNIGESRTATA